MSSSTPPLIAPDTDSRPDIYDWEAQGVGGCTLAPGCVGLISGAAKAAASSTPPPTPASPCPHHPETLASATLSLEGYRPIFQTLTRHCTVR